jgi:hypothetical protein
LSKLFATEKNETLTSLSLLMLFNAVGYGVFRPLMTNGMFFGWLGLQDWWHHHRQEGPLSPRDVSQPPEAKLLGLSDSRGINRGFGLPSMVREPLPQNTPLQGSSDAQGPFFQSQLSPPPPLVPELETLESRFSLTPVVQPLLFSGAGSSWGAGEASSR